jgi:hypothetical protein
MPAETVPGAPARARVGVGVSRDRECAVAVREAVRDARAPFRQDCAPGVAVVHMTQTYLDKLEEQGVNFSELLASNGVCADAMCIYGLTPAGVGALLPDGATAFAQNLGDELCPRGTSDLFAVMLLHMPGLEAVPFSADMPRSRSRATGPSRAADGAAHATFDWRAHIAFRWPAGGAAAGWSPATMWLSGRAFAIDGLQAAFHADLIGGLLLKPTNSQLSAGRTFVRDGWSTKLCGLSVRCDAARARVTHFCSGTQSKHDAAGLEAQMDAFRASYADAASAAAARGVALRPVFAYVITCVGRYPEATFGDYRARGCDMARFAASFPGVPALAAFSMGEILPDSAANRSHSCCISLFSEAVPSGGEGGGEGG